MAASYPTSIKSFLTYHDQPTNPTLVVPDPDKPGSTVDLTIDRAHITDEIHDEVIAMEQTIGLGKATIPGATTYGSEVKWLLINKSSGRVDPTNNCIYPNADHPALSHTHSHRQLIGLDADVHSQYVRVDGSRGFNAPVSSPWGTQLNHLCPMGQAQHVGWVTSPEMDFIIYVTVASASTHPVRGPAPQRYRMTGGAFAGPTDANGNVWIDFSDANFAGVLSVVYMKMPFAGRSNYGYTYQYEEDQLLMLAITNQGFMVQFIEDVIVDRQANVALAWMAVGV